MENNPSNQGASGAGVSADGTNRQKELQTPQITKSAEDIIDNFEELRHKLAIKALVLHRAKISALYKFMDLSGRTARISKYITNPAYDLMRTMMSEFPGQAGDEVAKLVETMPGALAAVQALVLQNTGFGKWKGVFGG